MTLTPERAQEITSAMGWSRTLVLGDVMLDRYIHGTVGRISPEAPVPIVEVEREYVALGGAANVSANLRALGDTALTLGVVGKDSASDLLREELNKRGLSSDLLLVDEGRQTTMKTRVVAERQQVARVDREDRDEIESEKISEIL
ncbi:MAG: bifunctional heptose 7-phosphate kinase/heptose 1-phosphate adenyltransferase, partial [Candidatus Zixiibacteriota bacterium]